MEIEEPTGLAPCDDPVKRAEIDADAAAAAAMKEVHRLVGLAGEAFATREHAAFLVRQPDGSIRFERLKAGPGGGEGPVLDETGLDFTQIVGYFHTHPSGDLQSPINHYDWSAVYNAIWQRGTNEGGDMSHLRMYVGMQSISYEDVTNLIHVWKGGNWGSTERLVKVSPDAIPCGS